MMRTARRSVSDQPAPLRNTDCITAFEGQPGHVNAAVERRRQHGLSVAPYRERRPLERLVRRADFATRTNPFKASFTASDVGKAAAFAGLRTTTFEPAARRAAYFPRMKPPGKSERL